MAGAAKRCHVWRWGEEQWPRSVGRGVSFLWKITSMFQGPSLCQGSGTALPLSSLPVTSFPGSPRLHLKLPTISTFKIYCYPCRIISLEINIKPSGRGPAQPSKRMMSPVDAYQRVLVSASQDGLVNTSQPETSLLTCVFNFLYYRLNSEK